MFRRKVSTRTASLTLGSCILAGTIAGFVLPMSLAMSAEPEPVPAVETLPLCPTEDSDNCRWDAAEQGNGEGRSFVVIDGTVTYDD